MSYQSLYRRYRPTTFDEVVGQKHVITALKNAIKDERVGHAYLFSGPRGTGKTTSARLLGKALNCTNLSDDAEPCNTCESCEAFLNGSSYDLHELDAASNNGVENVRDLINKVALGSPGRAKVYILDEVHMLTSGAENALLKTLEEPPDHVTFVLATTEPHKVVPTIRSRTQHYEFELLPADALEAHVRWVSDDAGLAVTDEMVDYVIRAGGGSARDTLSALDQVVAAGGTPRDEDAVGVILSGLAGMDAAAVIAGVSGALTAGRDPRVIGETLLSRLRDAFLVSMDAPLHHLSEAQTATARELSEAMGPASITRALETMGTALVDMRQAPDPRVDLEVALLRLSRPNLDKDLAAVVARLERLEAGAPPVAAAPAQQAQVPAAQEAAPAPAAASPTEAAAPAPAPAAAAPTEATAPPSGVSPAAAARAALAASKGDAPAPAAPAEAADGGPGDRPTLGAARRQQAQGQPAQSAEPEPARADAAGAPGAPPAEPAPSPDTAPAPQPTAQQPPAQEAPPVQPEAPAAAAAAPAPASGEGLSEQRVLSMWPDILASLGGRARSRFSGGAVVGVQGNTVNFGLPNDIHRQRCQECVEEVGAALSKQLGAAVELVLVVDAGSPPVPRASDPRPKEVAAPAATEPEAEEVVDLSALVDASDTESDGLSELQSAFPGAELVEPES